MNTSDYIVSMAHVLKIATAVFMYLLIYNGIQTNSDARKVLYSIVIATIIPMLIGYYQFFTLTGGTGVMGILNRVKGTLVMANEYGIFLSIGLCAALMLLLQENGRFRRVFLICSAVSIAISSILALNRGTWIALTASFLFAYPFYRTKVKAKWFFIVGLIMAIFFSGIILERFMQLGETMPWGGTQNTFSRRIDMWKTISSLLHVHPVAGFGIGTSNLVTSKFFRIDNVPHNDYLRLLLEIGIPGVLLYILFLAKELYRNIRLPFDKKYWVINFPTLVMVTYWIIMSSVQNIIYDVINFPLFLTLLAVSRRWNEMSFSEENKL
ncbi:MAG: O-antigen ligase family protein [Desulfobacterales bacterium]